jgi:hypothetical protein
MPASTKKLHGLSAVEPQERRKSEKEIEIERLASLGLQDLSDEDMRRLQRIRDCRASLQEAENEKEELKERLKARKASLEMAIADACNHFENRQLALNFGSA